jgi:predicted Holliday junction resolvase-like endonuclease
MLNLFPRFRFPLMFRYVHERHVASLRFDIEQLQNALNYEHKQCEEQLAHQLKHANLALAESHARAAKPRNELKVAEANHTKALQALELAYQKSKADMQRLNERLSKALVAQAAVLPFATFRQGEVSYDRR